MVTEGPAHAFHGRRVECRALEALLEAVRGGQSRVLVVWGEPGVGKTALVESVIGSASGFRVMRAVGVGVGVPLAARRAVVLGVLSVVAAGCWLYCCVVLMVQ